MMDKNVLLNDLREYYPDLKFTIDNCRLYVNGEKICVLHDDTEENIFIEDAVVEYAKLVIKWNYSTNEPTSKLNILTNIPTIGSLKSMIIGENDNLSLVGNCVDKFGNWYVYPCYIAKVPGDNNMVSIQLKPVNERVITDCIEELKDKIRKIIKESFPTHSDGDTLHVTTEIMKLIVGK